ncbi:Quorum-quenching protein AidA [Paraconexibacter sp. AEG42_29]|uniref:Quorum-quenching protein AidA n=1 Tax=Paraconexibacter sp. AEG42_29 TaxID=2997339 RepID=A0AAU7AUV5_9ACTN
MRRDISVGSGGEQLAVWHYPGAGDALAGPGGRPCIAMAHGFGATRDSGLEAFAEAHVEAGADVLLFDYRHFGASSGEPRQLISPAAQRADYHAVIAHARSLDGVDPDRIVAWGVSLAGGHVLQVGAEDPRLAAVVALTPAPDGLAAMRVAIARDGMVAALRLTGAGLADLGASLRGRAPVTVPTAGPPGSTAVLTAPGAEERWRAVVGPTWENNVCARVLLQFGGYRPGRHAAKLTMPLLVQIADLDQTAPPAAAMVAARRGRAEVRHLPADHFDVYPGGPHHEAAVRQQVDFLRRHLGAPVAAASSA